MGSFEGHVIPSIAYSLLALWWGFITSIKYIRTLRNDKLKFTGTTIMPCIFFPTRKLRILPIESFLKVILLSFHAFIEIYTGTHKSDDGSRWVFENENAHHVCMISGFIVGAIIEILIFYGVPFPPKTDYMFSLLAFLIQALLMTGHLNGDTGLEYKVHMLWTVLIVLTFAAACVELYNTDSFWAIYVRILFFLSQGTWLMQIAFVVWPHTDNPLFIWKMDHTSHTWLSISLMFHLIFCAILLMIEYLFVYFLINVFDKYYQRYELDLEEVKKIQIKGYEKTDERVNDREYTFLIDEEE